MVLFFFFQAEDGIRDKLVTGVQTCALPIFHEPVRAGGPVHFVSLASQCVDRFAVAGCDDEPLGEPREHAKLGARAREELRDEARRQLGRRQGGGGGGGGGGGVGGLWGVGG